MTAHQALSTYRTQTRMAAVTAFRARVAVETGNEVAARIAQRDQGTAARLAAILAARKI